MPGMGGKDTCRRICQTFPGLPIIMLTVRDDEEDIVESLDAGAFDYVTKPFQIRELTARLRGVIRRRHAPSGESHLVSIVGEITLDANRRLVEKRGEQIHLAPKEYETLRCLMEHAGRPVRHEQLLRTIWGPNYCNEREYLRVVINQLRKKIEHDPAQPVYILTESHIGYRFREE
jgi:two-component system KDP operon response regulator KdpE